MSPPELFLREDESFLGQALELARQAEANGEVPVGAVVVVDGKVCGRGFNSPIRLNDPSAHAEILALREAAGAFKNYRLQAATLYATLEPCVMCAGAIVNARLDRVVFGATDSKAGAVTSLFQVLTDSRLNHRPQVTAGVLADNCGQCLKDFFRRRRTEQDS